MTALFPVQRIADTKSFIDDFRHVEPACRRRALYTALLEISILDCDVSALREVADAHYVHEAEPLVSDLVDNILMNNIPQTTEHGAAPENLEPAQWEDSSLALAFRAAVVDQGAGALEPLKPALAAFNRLEILDPGLLVLAWKRDADEAPRLQHQTRSGWTNVLQTATQLGVRHICAFGTFGQRQHLRRDEDPAKHGESLLIAFRTLLEELQLSGPLTLDVTLLRHPDLNGRFHDRFLLFGGQNMGRAVHMGFGIGTFADEKKPRKVAFAAISRQSYGAARGVIRDQLEDFKTKANRDPSKIRVLEASWKIDNGTLVPAAY